MGGLTLSEKRAHAAALSRFLHETTAATTSNFVFGAKLRARKVCFAQPALREHVTYESVRRDAWASSLCADHNDHNKGE
jgi:hypothetical protein